MGLDLRWPIGLMFMLLGALLAVYGVATGGDAMYGRSLGYNVNLIWGAVLWALGTSLLLVLLLGRRRRAASAGAGDPGAARSADR
ncbi:MAG TPA: hypothetical protein PLW65_26100 [Pseudomonadota bacterium]|nr:hypothetical protein [Pseudomonadota bacterium]